MILAGGSEESLDDEWEISFLINRSQYLAKKNKRPSRRSGGIRGSSSKEEKDNQKGCFNYKKFDRFIVECLELQKVKSKKGIF